MYIDNHIIYITITKVPKSCVQFVISIHFGPKFGYPRTKTPLLVNQRTHTAHYKVSYGFSRFLFRLLKTLNLFSLDVWHCWKWTTGSLNENLRISIKIVLKFVPNGCQLIIGHHWFRWWDGTEQATSNYLNLWWLILLTHRCVTTQICVTWSQ